MSKRVGRGLTANPVAHVVRGVAGQVNSAGPERPNLKDLIIIKKRIKDTIVLIRGDAVTLTKDPLDLANALANADAGLVALHLLELLLQVEGRGQMVGMGVGLKDLDDLITVLLDQLENVVGRMSLDGAGDIVVVQHRVDDDGLVSSRVGNDILEGRGDGLKERMDEGLLGGRRRGVDHGTAGVSALLDKSPAREDDRLLRELSGSSSRHGTGMLMDGTALGADSQVLGRKSGGRGNRNR